MEKKEKINTEETKTEGTGVETADIVIEEGKGKKILKWVVKGVVVAVTFAAGLLLGKGIGGKDDSEETTENTETNE